MHAYLVLVNCAVVNKWEGSVDDKPENSCCQLLRVTASKDRAKLEIDPKIEILKLCQNKA